MHNQFFTQQLGYQFLTLGWYMSTFLAGALAILSGTGSISHEVETGTILSLASKPIPRGSILAGKFLAYTLVTSLYSGLLVGTVTVLAKSYFKLIFIFLFYKNL
jgi:ABC-type transport system involved in multi-copper enzyme maturation permease subunit